MKKHFVILLIIISLAIFSDVHAQIKLNLEATVIDKVNSEVVVGEKVKIIGITRSDLDNNYIQLITPKGGQDIKTRKIDRLDIKVNNIEQFWQKQALERGIYEKILENGYQYDIRKEAEEEALTYLNKVEQYNLGFNDSYLENYLYSLVYKIFPINLKDGRPGFINIKVIKDITPNASVYPNGTLIIHTGLLSTLNTEEELIGVLAHEISHFVFDHAIQNINMNIQRQKRAEFWAGILTGLAAATEVYLASENEYYEPGALTISTAILSTTIASEITHRLGLNYSREQEAEADEGAFYLMKQLNINQDAFATALSKIKSYNINNGNFLALTGGDSHPKIEERINRMGTPQEYKDINYDKKISFVNSFNAILEFNMKHLDRCRELVNRNIEAGVPTEQDYLILAMTNMQRYDTPKENKKALNWIIIAESLNTEPTINLPKQKALALIRLERNKEAGESLRNYQKALINERNKLQEVRNSKQWAVLNEYIANEISWTKKMIQKVHLL